MLYPFFRNTSWKSRKCMGSIVGASTSNLKLFFADALEENDSELSVEPSNTTGEYTIDLSSVSKKTGYIRGTGAAPYISKIEVFTKNDARPALSAPAPVLSIHSILRKASGSITASPPLSGTSHHGPESAGTGGCPAAAFRF